MTSGRARLLVALWLLTAVLTALPALLLLSFAEDAAARGAALLLLLSAGVAVAGAAVAGSGTRRALQLSLGASGLVAVAAVSGLAILAADGNVGVAGGLLFGGVALVGAGVTAIVAAARLWLARA